MDLKTYLKQHAFLLIAGTIAALAVLLLVFRIGVSLGYRKAFFACAWSANYHRNFGGPRSGGFGQFFDRELTTPAHGVFGRVVGSGTDILIVAQENGTEKTVIVGTGTTIVRLRDQIRSEDIHIGEQAVVIGQPNGQGQVEATFIRLLPAGSVSWSGRTWSFRTFRR